METEERRSYEKVVDGMDSHIFQDCKDKQDKEK